MTLEYLSLWNIVLGILAALTPVWIAMAVLLIASLMFKRKLGLYGHLFDSGVGIAGFIIVSFWVFAAIFANQIAMFDPIAQIAPLKNKLPGVIDPTSGNAYLLGGDKLARDIFGRVIHGSRIVLIIAPAATLIAFMTGISLGLPAGYFGGRTDAVLSFLANLVLAFPVILLFYLLVTPGIMETPVPYAMAGVFFFIPILFLIVLFTTRYKERPGPEITRPLRKHAGNLRGTSCYGKFCQTPVVHLLWMPAYASVTPQSCSAHWVTSAWA